MCRQSGKILGIAVAIVISACGPSEAEHAAEQAADRLDAAWQATQELDLARAKSEFEAAEALSPETVANSLLGLEARMAALEAWDAAEANFLAGRYLEAIAGYEEAAETSTFLARQAQEKIRASEAGFVDRTLSEIASGIARQAEQGYAEAFEALAAGLSEFPESEAILAARSDVAEVYFPSLVAQVEALLEQDEPEEAQTVLNDALDVLGPTAPDADQLITQVSDAVNEAAEARRIAAQQERERAAEEQRLAREAAQREREQIFARIRCDRDDLEQIYYCYDRETYSRLTTNRLYLFTFQRDGQRPSLLLGIETRGSNWIFWETARIYVDGRTFTIDAGYFNVNRDNSSRETWEYYIRAASSSDLAMAAAIADADEVYIRYINSDNVYREYRMSAAQIRAVGNVLAYWNEFN